MTSQVVPVQGYSPRAYATARKLTRLIPHWHADPRSFIEESFRSDPYGNRVHAEDYQVEWIEAVRDNDRVAIRSGRGVGKTAGAAMIVHWFLLTYFPARVVTSAGTWNHLQEQLWPEIRAWGNVWEFRSAFEYQQMGIYSLANPEIVRASALSSDKPTNVEGAHNPNFLLLIDEAKGMADEVFAAFLASMTGQDNHGVQKVVALSTPPLANVGWFAKHSSGTNWKTSIVSGLDSPRVSQAYIDEIREDYGENSPEYQSYVLGEIPEGTTETLIQSRWIPSCQTIPPNKATSRATVITCDVAREGEDLTVFGLFDNDRFNLVQFDDTDRWGWIPHGDLMEVAGRCVHAIKQYRASAICIDDTGLGGGVTDRLRELQNEGAFSRKVHINPVKFGRKPRNAVRFSKLKDELWWFARESIRRELIGLPTDEEIRSWSCPRGSDFKTQLNTPIYEYDSSDRIKVLDKRVSNREKTKALPTKSPDLAHAFILGVRYYLGQVLEEAPHKPREGYEEQDEELWEMVQQVAREAKKPLPKDPYKRRK